MNSLLVKIAAQSLGVAEKATHAFCMVPEGTIRFNELLEIIRKSCTRKGDLWQHLYSFSKNT